MGICTDTYYTNVWEFTTPTKYSRPLPIWSLQILQEMPVGGVKSGQAGVKSENITRYTAETKC